MPAPASSAHFFCPCSCLLEEKQTRGQCQCKEMQRVVTGENTVPRTAVPGSRALQPPSKLVFGLTSEFFLADAWHRDLRQDMNGFHQVVLGFMSPLNAEGQEREGT